MRWNKTEEERFWSKVDKSGECWVWTAGLGGGGYACFSVKRRKVIGHRWIYQRIHGEQPRGVDICHACDNRRCVRPEHLFAGTRADNMRDCAQKGRNAMQLRPERSRFNRPVPPVFGEQQGHAKLTTAQVFEIRALKRQGISSSVIAARFGIHPAHARKVASGTSRKHEQEPQHV